MPSCMLLLHLVSECGEMAHVISYLMMIRSGSAPPYPRSFADDRP